MEEWRIHSLNNVIMFPEKKGWYGGNLLRQSKVTGFTNCSSIFALKEATVQGKLALNPPPPLPRHFFWNYGLNWGNWGVIDRLPLPEVEQRHVFFMFVMRSNRVGIFICPYSHNLHVNWGSPDTPFGLKMSVHLIVITMEGTLPLFMLEFCTTTHNYTWLIISSTKYNYITHAPALAVGKKLRDNHETFRFTQKTSTEKWLWNIFFSLNNIEEI